MLLEHAEAAREGRNEVAEGHHNDQGPELEVDEYAEQNQMADDDEPCVVAHLFSALVTVGKKRIPKEKVNIRLAKKMGNKWEHVHLELLEVKGEPAHVIQPGEVYGFEHNLLIEPSVDRELVVLHMTDAEVESVVPGEKAEDVVKDFIHPLGFKRGSMAELMNGCFHPHKAVEHAVNIAGRDHGYP